MELCHGGRHIKTLYPTGNLCNTKYRNVVCRRPLVTAAQGTAISSPSDLIASQLPSMLTCALSRCCYHVHCRYTADFPDAKRAVPIPTTQGPDATDGNHPQGNQINDNFFHEIGHFQKQISCYFQGDVNRSIHFQYFLETTKTFCFKKKPPHFWGGLTMRTCLKQ